MKVRKDLNVYAIQYHKKGKKKTGYEIYLAQTSKSARQQFKSDFGKSRVIEWIRRR